MKINTLLALLAGSLVLTACASMTGVTNWKEKTLQSNLTKEESLKKAKQTLATIGTVNTADDISINGECAKYVGASIIVFDRDKLNYYLIKSRLDVNPNAMVIETGDRQSCIDKIAAELINSGAAKEITK